MQEEINKITEGCVKELKALFTPDPALPKVIVFNVGGTLVSVTAETLAKYPSSTLYRSAYLHYVKRQHCGQVDDAGNIYISADPHVFSVLINYLRGYRTPCSPSVMDYVVEDALWLNLPELIPIINPDSERRHLRMMTFANAGTSDGGRTIGSSMLSAQVGPYFSSNGDAGTKDSCVRSSDTVSSAGNRYSKIHKVAFKIISLERLAFGLITPDITVFDVDFSREEGCAAYFSSGKLYHNYPNLKAENYVPLEVGMVVTVVIDFDAKLLMWHVSDANVTAVVKMSPLMPSALAFAVMLQGSSKISIV